MHSLDDSTREDHLLEHLTESIVTELKTGCRLYMPLLIYSAFANNCLKLGPSTSVPGEKKSVRCDYESSRIVVILMCCDRVVSNSKLVA